ncbi:MAG: hypothetical protein IJZ07_07835 [Clostridia bacterium]|nr:hypothetical protein [Clostridia bacterium]
MKKFLSIALALVCILSTATVAFASTNICPYCEETYTNETEYNKHLANCDGYFRVCSYGCGADFATVEELAIHEGVCLEYKGECDYCGEIIVTKNAFNAHVEECKVKYFQIPVHKIMKFLQETDLYEKVFGTIFGLFADIPYNDVFGTVFEYLEKGIHLGVSELA